MLGSSLVGRLIVIEKTTSRLGPATTKDGIPKAATAFDWSFNPHNSVFLPRNHVIGRQVGVRLAELAFVTFTPALPVLCHGKCGGGGGDGLLWAGEVGKELFHINHPVAVRIEDDAVLLAPRIEELALDGCGERGAVRKAVAGTFWVAGYWLLKILLLVGIQHIGGICTACPWDCAEDIEELAIIHLAFARRNIAEGKVAVFFRATFRRFDGWVSAVFNRVVFAGVGDVFDDGACFGTVGGGSTTVKSWEEQCSQNSNDGDAHEKFDESQGVLGAEVCFHSARSDAAFCHPQEHRQLTIPFILQER